MPIQLTGKQNKDEIKEVTCLYTTKVKLTCPYCEAEVDGFLSDPSGSEFECDSCGETYKVSLFADIKFGFPLTKSNRNR